MIKKLLKRIDKILLGSIAVLFFLSFDLMDNIFGTDYTVKMWVIKIILLVCFLIIIIIYSIFSVLSDDKNEKEFKVFKVNMGNTIEMIYLKPNERLNLNDIVSVYVDDSGIEKLVGLGYVFLIQEKNKLIQIELIYQKDDIALIELCKNYDSIIIRKEINYKSLNELLNITKGDE